MCLSPPHILVSFRFRVSVLKYSFKNTACLCFLVPLMQHEHTMKTYAGESRVTLRHVAVVLFSSSQLLRYFILWKSVTRLWLFRYCCRSPIFASLHPGCEVLLLLNPNAWEWINVNVLSPSPIPFEYLATGTKAVKKQKLLTRYATATGHINGLKWAFIASLAHMPSGMVPYNIEWASRHLQRVHDLFWNCCMTPGAFKIKG